MQKISISSCEEYTQFLRSTLHFWKYNIDNFSWFLFQRSTPPGMPYLSICKKLVLWTKVKGVHFQERAVNICLINKKVKNSVAKSAYKTWLGYNIFCLLLNIPVYLRQKKKTNDYFSSFFFNADSESEIRFMRSHLVF